MTAGVERAERQNNAWNIIVTHWLGLGQVCAIQGCLDEAISHLESAAALTDEWGISFFRPPVRATLAVLYARAGRHTEGLSLREDAGTADESAGWAIYSTLSSIQLAETRLLEGQIDQARVAAEGALERCRRSAHRRFEAYALHLLGEIAAHPTATRFEEAIQHYGRALALAEELEMRPLVAHCHLGLDRLYRRPGDHQPAQEHLTTATTLYREMDMRFWLVQAEGETRELG